MQLLLRCLALTLALSVGAGLAAQEDWSVRRQKLGTEDPYRVLVDKVLMLSTGWVMQPEHMAEIREAGFNVVVPRIGADDDARVRRVAQMASDHGLFYMPWIRGTRATKGPVDQRATAYNGQVGNLASPNSDELWAYWRDRSLFYAELSREMPSVMGVFLDFENYDEVKIGGGMCYTLSYDEPILRQFAEAQGFDLPDPLPGDRRAWLEDQGMTEAFHGFQTGSWRRRCRELRQAIDAINPQFQFVVYPAGHSPFITEAVWHEWHTAEAPLIMAEVDTYWRHEFRLQDALAAGQAILKKRRAELDSVDPTIRYMAGLDPVVSGADPEFEGKSAVMGTEATNGYWVFYEGPTYGQQDHADYFAWFKRANESIANDDFSLWRQPPELPNPLTPQLAAQAREVAGQDLVPFSTEPLDREEMGKAFTHRPAARYQVLLRKGELLKGELIALQHAHLTNGSAAAIVTPSGELLGEVVADIGSPAPIEFEASESGVYGIAITSGRAKGRLRLENRYVCLAGPKIQLVFDQPPAYLIPRAGSDALAFSVSTYVPGEHVRVVVKNSDGTTTLDQTTLDRNPVQISCDSQGKVEPWAVELTKAVEDIEVTLGDSCEPRLATHPGRLLVAANDVSPD